MATIFFIVFVVFTLLVYISIKGIVLNPVKHTSKLIQEVTVETLVNNSLDDTNENIEKLQLQPAESFCQSYLGNSAELEPACNRLTETNCAQTSCCVFITNGNGNGKCVAGDKFGPTYKNGNMYPSNSYYYLGEKNI